VDLFGSCVADPSAVGKEANMSKSSLTSCRGFDTGFEPGQKLTILGDPWPETLWKRAGWILRTPVFGWRSPKLFVTPRRVSHSHKITAVESTTELSF
jgi:hypothetical protein